MKSSLSPLPSPFDATLVEPLWKKTTLVLLLSAGVTLALLVADLVLGSPRSSDLAFRALSLPLFALFGAAFWRDRTSPRAVLAYAFCVAGVDMALVCTLILVGGKVGGEVYGTLYPLLLLPALFLCYRPMANLLLEAMLLGPALLTVVSVSTDASHAAGRVLLLCSVAAFAFFMAHSGYWTRRREYESAQGLLRAKDTLQEAERQLVQAEKLSALGTLSACIAHELAQPLTLLMGYANVLSQRLKKGVPSPDDLKSHVKQLDVMLHATKRMSSIIDHLRGFARRSGRPRCTSVNDVVHGALLFVEGELARAGVALTLDLTKGAAPPPLVVADPIELEQVVLNLLTNARDALRNVPHPALRITTGHEGDDVFIEVHDNGPGVLPELRETMFQFFVTTKPVGQGTGLGLWVSQGIVRNLAGNLQLVDGGDDGGATFRVTLPRAPEKDRLAMTEDVGEGPASGAATAEDHAADDEDEREEDNAPRASGPQQAL